MDPISISAMMSALMSNPATWVALASLAGGTYMQSKARESVADQQQQVQSSEAQRQQQLDRKRQEQMAAAQPQFTRQQQEQQKSDIASKMTAYLTPGERVATAGEYLPSNPGAPKEVADRRDQVLAGALDKGKTYAAGLADTSSLGRLGLNNALTLNRLGEAQGQVNDASNRSSQILPLELQAANRAGNGYRTYADLLNGAGTIASMFALRGPTPSVPGTGGNPGGITLPDDMGWDPSRIRVPGAGGGIDPSRAGIGLKTAGIPRLTL